MQRNQVILLQGFLFLGKKPGFGAIFDILANVSAISYLRRHTPLRQISIRGWSCEYYDLVTDMVRPEVLILAYNVIWDGMLNMDPLSHGPSPSCQADNRNHPLQQQGVSRPTRRVSDSPSQRRSQSHPQKITQSQSYCCRSDKFKSLRQQAIFITN